MFLNVHNDIPPLMMKIGRSTVLFLSFNFAIKLIIYSITT